jgi:hypothetical protein
VCYVFRKEPQTFFPRVICLVHFTILIRNSHVMFEQFASLFCFCLLSSTSQPSIHYDEYWHAVCNFLCVLGRVLGEEVVAETVGVGSVWVLISLNVRKCIAMPVLRGTTQFTGPSSVLSETHTLAATDPKGKVPGYSEESECDPQGPSCRIGLMRPIHPLSLRCSVHLPAPSAFSVLCCRPPPALVLFWHGDAPLSHF